jgi:Leucine Rich repeat
MNENIISLILSYFDDIYNIKNIIKATNYNGLIPYIRTYGNITNNRNLLCEQIKLYAVYNVTNEGIENLGLNFRNLPLTELNLARNNKITDEGIKNLGLNFRNLSLTYLNLNHNKKITDEGIKKLNLRDLKIIR